MLKTCPECKKEFEATPEHRKYCSDACAGQSFRRKLAESKAKYQKRIFEASKPQ